MKERELLIAAAIEAEGNYFEIRRLLAEKRIGLPSGKLPEAVTILDGEYPAELRELKFPPFVLFCQGNKELLKTRKASIVGSRQASEYGYYVTAKTVGWLKKDYTLVSGMAKGIDAAVHWQAERTIGVLGNGLNVVYPRENRELYEYMKDRQLLITEYPANVKPARYHFPFRNRIIAALGEKTVVCQARVKSGTMLTVNEALNLGREVWTVPYAIDDIDGSGCNYLIQQGADILWWNYLKDEVMPFDKNEKFY